MLADALSRAAPDFAPWKVTAGRTNGTGEWNVTVTAASGPSGQGWGKTRIEAMRFAVDSRTLHRAMWAARLERALRAPAGGAVEVLREALAPGWTGTQWTGGITGKDIQDHQQEQGAILMEHVRGGAEDTVAAALTKAGVVDGRWHRLTADEQRSAFGFPIFGKREFRVSLPHKQVRVQWSVPPGDTAFAYYNFTTVWAAMSKRVALADASGGDEPGRW
jgi:hypothetical protein